MSEQLSENIKPGPKPGLKLTRTTKGYLVRGGSKTYEVTVEDDAISCNCSDFEREQKENITYHCKHIIAVLADFEAQQSCASANEHTNGSSSKANGSAKYLPFSLEGKLRYPANKVICSLNARSVVMAASIPSVFK